MSREDQIQKIKSIGKSRKGKGQQTFSPSPSHQYSPLEHKTITSKNPNS
jgi:hypothetical protein